MTCQAAARRRQQGREVGLVETAGRRPGERRRGDPLLHPRVDRCVQPVQAGEQHDLAVEEVRLDRAAAGQALPGGTALPLVTGDVVHDQLGQVEAAARLHVGGLDPGSGEHHPGLVHQRG